MGFYPESRQGSARRAGKALPVPAVEPKYAVFDRSVVAAPPRLAILHPMHEVKDTLRATVRIGYDGRVHKTFRGPKAEERFANEIRILRYLEEKGCPFVPRLLESYPEQLKIVTSSCGQRVEHLDADRTKELFAELEAYGVRHDDPEMRNVTYRQSDGRFCLIDFEFATILPSRPADAA
jgi:tRNA A-37 threonylcarbamoyl transferase component Bud32